MDECKGQKEEEEEEGKEGDNFGCSHTCVNTPGSAYCECPIGYSLGTDNKTCHGEEDCGGGGVVWDFGGVGCSGVDGGWGDGCCALF